MCVWVEDADDLDINSPELEVLYTNRIINSYLSSKSGSLGLAALKGQGKTFLIKVRRKRISENDSEPSDTCGRRHFRVRRRYTSFRSRTRPSGQCGVPFRCTGRWRI